MKHFLKYTFVLLVTIFIAHESYGYTILVDPGHGGEDVGAKSYIYVGKKKVTIYEKDLALEISKLIHQRLSKNYYTYLTRSIDRTVSLEDRAQMAEKLKADLFISVHMNSSYNKTSHGFETYYLDNHDNVAIQKVEEAENRNLKGGDLIVQKILTDLVIQKTVSISKPLASMVHANIKDGISKYRIKDRGAKPGVFYVLALSKRPGVLLEAGFMSNPVELKLLRNKTFQKNYADSIAKAVVKFVSKNVKKKISLF